MGTTTDAGDHRAPVADDPLGPVLAPEHDLVAFADAGLARVAREPAAPRESRRRSVCRRTR